MFVQWFVKGIAGHEEADAASGISKAEAFAIASSGEGLFCNWLRQTKQIPPAQVGTALTDANLDRHLHDYDNYGPQSAFISLATGCVEREKLLQQNIIYSAIDTALAFATDNGLRPGALFFGWVATAMRPAVAVQYVAEAVRELHVYRRWSPYQLEGEVTAKIHVPANQIQKVEWWDRDHRVEQRANPLFLAPDPLLAEVELF